MKAERVGSVLYGGDYAPECSAESVWTEDMKLMREAGVNLVTLAGGCWTHLQPKPDQWKWGWLDRVVELLPKHGVSFSLATGTGFPPAWLIRQHPEVMADLGGGNRQASGARPSFCPTSAEYRKASAELARQLAARYGQHPSLVMWQVNNRYAAHVGCCFCPVCTSRFQAWLEEKYQTVQALNEQWGCDFWCQPFSDWDEILPPRRQPRTANPAHELDYHRFMSESLLACFLNEKAVLKEITPRLPVTTAFTGPHGLPKAINCFQWAEQVDIVSFGSYPDPRHTDGADVAFSLDVQRGLSQGRPWLLTEQAASQVNWRKHNAIKRPGQMRLWSYQALAHGADGLLFHQWRAPRAGSGKFHSAMLPHGGPQTRVFREVVQLGQELAQLGLLCGGRIPAEIGLVLDWDNYWATELDYRPAPLDYSELVRSYYQALFEPDLAIDVIQPESDLSRYKLVVVPALYLVRDGVAENISDFVANGGTLVMGFFSGIADANDRIIPGGFPGPFRKLLGIHVEEIETLEAQQTRHVRTSERTGKCSQWVDLIQLEGAEAVATFADDFYSGRPAITRNAFGRGLAYYVGTQVEVEFLRRICMHICEETGIHPPLKVPNGVEVITRVNEYGRALFLLNHTANTQHVDLGSIEGTELISGDLLSGAFPLAPHDVRVVHIPAEE
jgi:beta-galactosidase